MLKGLFSALIFSLVLVGQVHAQEVIVGHEKKPEAPKQAAPSSEQMPSESPTPVLTKPKSREKKSGSTKLTAEQMRMAGALAAERLENRNSPQPARTVESESELGAAELPTVYATPKPVKKEPRTGQTSVPHRSSSRTPKPEPIGAVRPTMMESGREEPSATPPEKAETPPP
ncbi:MAG: hypothetical protein WBX14_06180, partial [Candidatus Udaeobacter sp.]